MVDGAAHAQSDQRGLRQRDRGSQLPLLSLRLPSALPPHATQVLCCSFSIAAVGSDQFDSVLPKFCVQFVRVRSSEVTTRGAYEHGILCKE